MSAIALTHGAGSNSNSPLLKAVGGALERAGFIVVRYDLPYRMARPTGPPPFGSAERDRGGIRDQLRSLRDAGHVPVYAGGHSYGGRQSSMLAAEDGAAADALLLLSYPLHPPRKPEQLRTAHFTALQTPALFVHGTRDPFGSPDELRAAAALIPGRVEFLFLDGAGHELRAADAPAIAEAFARFTRRE